jgi:hypothetical protein
VLGASTGVSDDTARLQIDAAQSIEAIGGGVTEKLPCAIPNCPALATFPAMYCAIHGAMSPHERYAAYLLAKAQSTPPQLRPVTTRVDYE